MRHSATLIILFLGLLTTGCEDSPEHKMGMASIALRKGDPSQALDHVNSVLLDQPENLAALKIKGTAHLRLRQYAECEKTLLQLLEKTPDDVEVHRELINWAYSTMAFNLSKSDFITNDVVREDFTRAKTTGHKHADWLANNEATKTEAEFIRARLILLDSRHLELRLKHEQFLLRDQVLSSDGGEVTSPTIEELNRQIRSMKFTAERHVQNVMAEKPEHFDSAMIYVNLLVEREAWSALWVMAEKLKDQKVTPPHLASKIVETVLKMPNQYHPRKERLDACQGILDTVEKIESPSFMMIQARVFMEMEKFHNAYELAEQLFKIQSSDHETRYLYGWTLFKLEKYDLAKTTISPLAAEFAGHAPIQSLYGRILIKLGDERGAINHLRRALEVDPELFAARSALIKVLANNQHTENAAFTDIKSLYEKNPGDPIAIRYMMRAFISRDDRMQVENLIEKVLNISPLTSAHIHGIVAGYTYLKDYPKAIQYAKELVLREPDAITSHQTLATVYIQTGNVGKAKKILETLHKKNPETQSVNLLLTHLYMSNGQYDQAIALSETMLERSSESIDFRIMLARALARLSLTDQAMEQVNLVLKQNEKEPRAHELAARIYRLLNQFDKADIHLQKIDQVNVNSDKYPGVAARLKMEKGLIDEALSICNRAVARGNATSLVRQILVEIQLNEKKDFAQGEIHLLAYAREHPDEMAPFSLLTRFYIKHNKDRGLAKLQELRTTNETLARFAESQILLRYGRNTQALKVLAEYYAQVIQRQQRMALTYAMTMTRIILAQDKQALDKTLPIWEALISAGGVYKYQAELIVLKLKRTTLSVDSYAAELVKLGEKLPFDQFNPFYSVSNSLTSMRKHEPVLELLNKWIQAKPTNPSLIGMKGDTLRYMGQFEEASKYYNEAIKISADPEPLHVRLIKTRQLMNDFPGTEAEIDRWAAVGTKAKIAALWAKGTFYNRLGMKEEAADSFKELQLSSRTGDPRVALALGESMATLGKFDDAMSYLTAVPPFANEYASAQLLLARIEGRNTATAPAAKERLKRLMENPATTILATKELINLTNRTDDSKQLLEWADHAINASKLPDLFRARWMVIRANLKTKQRDWIEVNKAIDQFLTIAPKNTSWHLAKVIVLIQLDKSDEARTYFNNNPELAKDATGKLVAAALGLKANIDKASSMHTYLISLINRDFDSASRAAKAIKNSNKFYFRQDLVDEIALAQSESQSKVDYKGLSLAAAAHQIGMYELAEVISHNVAQKSPQSTLAHAMKLAALSFQGDQQGKAKDELISSAPASSLGLFTRSSTSGKAKGYDIKLAIKDAQSLTKREPDHYIAALQLIGLLVKANQNEDALAQLKKWDKIKGPHQGMVANDLAYLLATRFDNRLDEAYEAAKRARDLLPQSTRVYDALGWIEHLRGNHAEAVKLLAKAWNSNSKSSDWHYHMGEAYAANNQIRWAKLHLQTAIRIGGEVKANAQASLETLEKTAAP